MKQEMQFLRFFYVSAQVYHRHGYINIIVVSQLIYQSPNGTLSAD